MVKDGKDAGGRLDIHSAHFDKFRHEALISAVTFHAWKTKLLLVPPNSFRFSIDSHGGPGADFVAYTKTTDGKNLSCELKKLGGRVIATDPGAVKGPRGFACAFGWGKLAASKQIRWRLVSIDGPHVDAAPDKGWATV